jgi:hypothetical protein
MAHEPILGGYPAMKIDELTAAYLDKAAVRMEALHSYRDRQAYSDVVREAQSVLDVRNAN